MNFFLWFGNMSNIAKKPIMIPNGVTINQNGQEIVATGPKGNASYAVLPTISVTVSDTALKVQATDSNDRKKQALAGLTRANLANMVKGVEVGFEKKLELVGVGYRAQMQGTDLVLSLGFSHPVKFHPKDGIKVVVADNGITVSGIDKMLVGEMASQIRAAKPPEPYKGKGIKYKGEKVRRKAGKAAKAGAK